MTRGLAALGATLTVLCFGPAASAQSPSPPVPPGPPLVPTVAPTLAAPTSPPIPDADWILQAQGVEGAIASHADRTYIDPYLASFGVTGLAAAARATGDARYADAAWREVEWYAASMDASGFVSDARVTLDGLAPTGTADSTDAYSGMFLLAVESVQAAAPDSARLLALAPKIAAAIATIRATQRADGLTGAKSDWMVAYLMNEGEAYAGLLAGARLASSVGDRVTARSATSAAARIARAVDRLWNPATRSYDWAVHPDGVHQTTNWGQLYPDAVSQVWAVRFGLVRRDRVAPLLRQFLATHPNAHDPNAIDLVDGRLRPTGYWPGLALALRLVDPGAPARFLAATRYTADVTADAWPYSVQVAGDALRLATGT
jgi:hypothetical protein